ncbi:MAG: hypothetical protein LBK59_02610 [Bifidobacteriaceae bacterium]|jgi:hypothetical protein|nr:hypothetical protein [Bifidobacteriaceae bacterium]
MDNTHVQSSADPIVAVNGRIGAAEVNAVRLLVAGGLVAAVGGVGREVFGTQAA